MSGWKLPASVAVTVCVTAGNSQQPTFRSRAEGVVITVSVTSGETPVEGLGASDFELLDRGIRQPIEVLSGQAIPLDLTLLLDLNQAFAEDLPRYVQAIRRLATELRDEDAMRLLVCGPRIVTLWPMTSARAQPLEKLSTISGTGEFTQYSGVLQDGLVHALARPTAPGRRHLIVALTKYSGGKSVASDRAIEEIARFGDATLFVATLPGVSPILRNYFDPIGRVAAVTGGQLLLGTVGGRTYESGGWVSRFGGGVVVTFTDATEALARVVREFHHSYVLGYVPTGVDLKGWHDVTVKVTRKSKEKYTVRTRSGYWGGGS